MSSLSRGLDGDSKGVFGDLSSLGLFDLKKVEQTQISLKVSRVGRSGRPRAKSTDENGSFKGL